MFRKEVSVAKNKLGTKRVCPETGRKFYDLKKDPIISPYTGKTYPVAYFLELASSTKVRKESARPKPSDVEDDEAEEEEELEDEDLEEDPAVEIVSLEDTDDDDDEDDEITTSDDVTDDDIPEIPDVELDDEDDDDAADDDIFLDDDEDDDAPIVGVVPKKERDDI